MTGGSIYIDPDGVTSVSNQMLKTADEIDALRRNIIPQVYNVVDTSYPALGNMPEIGLPLTSTQEGIGGFSYEAETVVQEIRAAAYTLNQVASEGRLMMEQLLQQAVMLGGPIGSSSASGGSWFQQLEGQLGGDWNATASIVESILQSGIVKNLANIEGSAIAILPLLEKTFPSFGKAMEDVPIVGPILDIAGIGLGIMAGGDYSPHTVAVDIVGGGVGIGVGFIPYVDIAVAAFALAHFGAMGASAGENLLAQEFTGNTRSQLLDASENWNLVAENTDTSKVLNDTGAIVVDTGTGIYKSFTGGFSWNNFSQPLHDLGNTGLDTARLAGSTVQFAANVETIVPLGTLALADKTVQILPLPQSVKNTANTMTGNMMQNVNQVADFVTKPDDVVSAWNTVKGWL